MELLASSCCLSILNYTKGVYIKILCWTICNSPGWSLLPELYFRNSQGKQGLKWGLLLSRMVFTTVHEDELPFTFPLNFQRLPPGKLWKMAQAVLTLWILREWTCNETNNVTTMFNLKIFIFNVIGFVWSTFIPWTEVRGLGLRVLVNLHLMSNDAWHQLVIMIMVYFWPQLRAQ